jgi:hypothetical protein
MDRRSFITGVVGLIAAPAIVRASSLMPVRGIVMPVVYGRSPAMAALETIRAVNNLPAELRAECVQQWFEKTLLFRTITK